MFWLRANCFRAGPQTRKARVSIQGAPGGPYLQRHFPGPEPGNGGPPERSPSPKGWSPLPKNSSPSSSWAVAPPPDAVISLPESCGLPRPLVAVPLPVGVSLPRGRSPSPPVTPPPLQREVVPLPTGGGPLPKGRFPSPGRRSHTSPGPVPLPRETLSHLPGDPFTPTRRGDGSGTVELTGRVEEEPSLSARRGLCRAAL